MDLSVVVVTYNSREHILECLRSLEPAAAGATMECVVVDNASADGTGELVRREAPWARVVDSGDNLGYAKAVNIGTQATTGEFVLVLNPDCILRPRMFEALRAWMHAHPRCAIAGPRIVGPDGVAELSGRSFPSPATFLFNRYSLLTLLWPGNPWSRRYLLSDWDRSTDRSVDWLSGSCMLVRRAAIEQVGGMDETFFMFNEDVDWCRCMKNAGWSVDFVVGAEAMHHIGASRRHTSPRVILERHRGMIHYFRKHHPLPALLDPLAAALIMLRARIMLLVNETRR